MLRKWMIVLLGAMLLLGAACGGGDDSSAGSGDAQETESVEPEASESAPAADGFTVTAVDFAFNLSSATLPAGETEITFTNEGKEQHQLFMARLTDDAPPIEDLIKLSEKKSNEFIEEDIPDGQDPIKPGDTTSFTVDLKPGNYGMVCFVSNDQGPHAFQGMYNTFTVE